MCAICGMGVPACNLAGGCGVQVLDFIKMAGITGGAGLGIALTTISEKTKRNAQGRRKQNEEKLNK